MTTMDLNSDLGESFGAWRMGDDTAILRIVTSANVACGFHAGDPAGILATVRAAVAQGVTIGAHVAYPDLVGFGRRNMDVTSAELQADVMYQIGALQGLATAAGTRVRYVKPHGALYNTIAHDERQAKAVIAAVRAVDPTLVLVALAGAPLVQWAREAGLAVVGEAFADRAYTPEGTLVSRREKGAVLHDDKLVAQRMLRLVREGVVEAIDLFTCEFKSPDNRRLIVPNNAIFGATIDNITHFPERRVDVNVSSPYDDDIDLTRAALERVFASVPGALQEPAPEVFLAGLGSSTVNWQLRVWCTREDYWAVFQATVREAKIQLEDTRIQTPG